MARRVRGFERDKIGRLLNAYGTKKATAQKLGVSYSTLYRWITGKSIPNPVNLIKINKRYGYYRGRDRRRATTTDEEWTFKRKLKKPKSKKIFIYDVLKVYGIDKRKQKVGKDYLLLVELTFNNFRTRYSPHSVEAQFKEALADVLGDNSDNLEDVRFAFRGFSESESNLTKFKNEGYVIRKTLQKKHLTGVWNYKKIWFDND